MRPFRRVFRRLAVRLGWKPLRPSRKDERRQAKQLAKKARTQLGALPFRTEPDGLQVLLATSRETKRWVIPKGWPMKKRLPHEAAAREAFEEAGLVGDIDEHAIGSYDYDKRMKDGAIVHCRVQVYAMRVTEQRRRWPEYKQRDTQWFGLEEAAASVQEAELAVLITNLESLLHLGAGIPTEVQAADTDVPPSASA